MECIRTASFYILVYRTVGEPFRLKRGIRQWDHISPSTFIFLKYLDRYINFVATVLNLDLVLKSPKMAQ